MKPSMPHRGTSTVLVAFVIAPLIAPIVLVTLKGVSEGFDRSHGPRGTFADIAVGFLMFSLFAYSAAILLGIPMFLIYQRRKVRSLLAYALGGFVISLITVLAVSSITVGFGRADLSAAAFGQSALVLFLCGGTSGAVFRLLALHDKA
jgi:hypothetical protein